MGSPSAETELNRCIYAPVTEGERERERGAFRSVSARVIAAARGKLNFGGTTVCHDLIRGIRASLRLRLKVDRAQPEFSMRPRFLSLDLLPPLCATQIERVFVNSPRRRFSNIFPLTNPPALCSLSRACNYLCRHNPLCVSYAKRITSVSARCIF